MPAIAITLHDYLETLRSSIPYVGLIVSLTRWALNAIAHVVRLKISLRAASFSHEAPLSSGLAIATRPQHDMRLSVISTTCSKTCGCNIRCSEKARWQM
jgi:hypothetical protein